MLNKINSKFGLPGIVLIPSFIYGFLSYLSVGLSIYISFLLFSIPLTVFYIKKEFPDAKDISFIVYAKVAGYLSTSWLIVLLSWINIQSAGLPQIMTIMFLGAASSFGLVLYVTHVILPRELLGRYLALKLSSYLMWIIYFSILLLTQASSGRSSWGLLSLIIIPVVVAVPIFYIYELKKEQVEFSKKMYLQLVLFVLVTYTVTFTFLTPVPFYFDSHVSF